MLTEPPLIRSSTSPSRRSLEIFFNTDIVIYLLHYIRLALGRQAAPPRHSIPLHAVAQPSSALRQQSRTVEAVGFAYEEGDALGTISWRLDIERRLRLATRRCDSGHGLRTEGWTDEGGEDQTGASQEGFGAPRSRWRRGLAACAAAPRSSPGGARPRASRQSCHCPSESASAAHSRGAARVHGAGVGVGGGVSCVRAQSAGPAARAPSAARLSPPDVASPMPHDA